MPRIYTGANDPLDFCARHFPKTEAVARERYGEGEGPDGRGNCFEYDAGHPSYDHDNYKCVVCKCLLTNANDEYKFQS